jgi:hypothetical protein
VLAHTNAQAWPSTPSGKRDVSCILPCSKRNSARLASACVRTSRSARCDIFCQCGEQLRFGSCPSAHRQQDLAVRSAADGVDMRRAVGATEPPTCGGDVAEASRVMCAQLQRDHRGLERVLSAPNAAYARSLWRSDASDS